MQALVTDRAAFAAAQRQVVAAAIAAGRCSRCKDGSGFVKHSAGRLHCGVPNLCFACDGAGTRGGGEQRRVVCGGVFATARRGARRPPA